MMPWKGFHNQIRDPHNRFGFGTVGMDERLLGRHGRDSDQRFHDGRNQQFVHLFDLAIRTTIPTRTAAAGVAVASSSVALRVGVGRRMSFVVPARSH